MIISKKKFVSWLLVLGTGAAALVVSSRAFDWSLSGPKPVRTTVPIVVNEAPLARETRMTTSFAPVVKRVAPSVVNVFTTKTVRNQSPEMMPFFDDPFFRRFFGEPFGGEQPRRQPRKFKERSLGSGVVVSKDGYILTNNHVVDGADEVKVSLAKDKKEYTAKIAGRDPKTDIAVLKIDARDLPFVTFADSDKIEVGDVVLALGNPFGIGQTVTMGIVSAVGRGGMHIEDYEDFIQTDAAINPGNSGGPLVDAEGRLIGINTAILSRSGGNQGVGFAVPVNLARNVMEQIIEKGAAAEAGLKSGDVIVELNGTSVKDSRNLKLMVGRLTPGDKATVKVLREGKEKTFTLTLKELPDHKRVTNAEEAVSVSKHVKAKQVLVRVWSHGGSRYVVVNEGKDK